MTSTLPSKTKSKYAARLLGKLMTKDSKHTTVCKEHIYFISNFYLLLYTYFKLDVS